MSDADGLLAAFEAGDLVRPSAGELNIVDLANAIASLLGVERSGTHGSRAIEQIIGRPDHLVFIAADGLGMSAVEAMGPDAFVPKHVAAELRTVFPSSTPVVFTSLATGEWPNQHGVTSWNVYLSEVDCVSTIIHFQRRSDEKSLGELGLAPDDAYPLPSLLGRATRNVFSILPEDIVDTPYNRYTSAGTPQKGYKTLPEAVDETLARAARAKAPTFTYVYVPDVDFVCHEYGTGHERARAVLQVLDRELERLVQGLPNGARLVLTADHGLVDADESEVYEVGPDEAILECLNREPWGDSRATHFDVRSGVEREFEQIFRQRFEDRFFLIPVEDAERLELYGPGRLSAHTRRRLGNHIAISKGAAVIDYMASKENDEDFHMVSHHSGLTPAEMMVPLVVA